MKTAAIIALLTSSLLHSSAFAQLSQPYRFEQEVKESEEGYTVIPMKTEGLALVNGTNTYDRGKRTWTVEFLDTILSTRWKTQVQLANSQNFVGYEYTPHHLYLLFRSGEYQGLSFELVKMDFIQQETKVNTVEFELSFRIAYFTVSGNNAVFGGYINNEPVVLLYDQSSEHPKVLPGLFVKNVELLDIRTNMNETFNVLLVERKIKERDILIFRTFDHEGNLLLDESIPLDSKYAALTGITSSLEREELLIAGTYAEGTSKQAVGIFTIVVDPFNEETVRYTDFASLDHFLDYLSPKKAAKIRTKSNEQKAAGKTPDFRLYVKPMRLEEKKDGYYLLTEAYNPSSSGSGTYWPGGYVSSPYYGVSPIYGSYRRPYNYYDPFPYNPTRHTEVRMIQSAVIKLSATGQPVHDFCIKLDEVRQPSLEQVSDFMVYYDSVYMAYKKEDKVLFRREYPSSEQDSITNELKIRSRNPMERSEEEGEGQIRYWYGDHFYVWGYQYIKVNGPEGTEKRNVFYVNRVSPGH